LNFFTFCIGLTAQGCFSARILAQWIMSERSHRVLSPTIFWVFSLIGSCIMFYYGWLRDDFSIIFGQFISFYIYIVNLHFKGIWLRVPLIVRLLLYATPVMAAIATAHNAPVFIASFLQNDKIPMWLIIFGTTGQFIFACRFIYQLIYSTHRRESLLPPTFWIISLVGASMIFIYGIIRLDYILMLGQSFGLVAYSRDLIIGRNQGNKQNIKENCNEKE
jgi:lipid-A-disaccharide synthase-like uncharacterized protein